MALVTESPNHRNNNLTMSNEAYAINESRLSSSMVCDIFSLKHEKSSL